MVHIFSLRPQEIKQDFCKLKGTSRLAKLCFKINKPKLKQKPPKKEGKKKVRKEVGAEGKEKKERNKGTKQGGRKRKRV